MVSGKDNTEIEDITPYAKGEDQHLHQVDPETGDDDDNVASDTIMNNDGKKDNDNDNNEQEEDLEDDDTPWKDRFLEVVKTFAPLGWVAFGGPQAHVAILRVQLVRAHCCFRL
jgi:hypothetical protein